jgi:hypothetical protein
MPPPGGRRKSFGRQSGTKVVARHGSNALGLVVLWEGRRERRIDSPSHTTLGNFAVRCKLCRHQEAAASLLAAKAALKLLLGMVAMRRALWFSGKGEGSGALTAQVMPGWGMLQSAASYAATRRPPQVFWPPKRH